MYVCTLLIDICVQIEIASICVYTCMHEYIYVFMTDTWDCAKTSSVSKNDDPVGVVVSLCKLKMNDRT